MDFRIRYALIIPAKTRKIILEIHDRLQKRTKAIVVCFCETYQPDRRRARTVSANLCSSISGRASAGGD